MSFEDERHELACRNGSTCKMNTKHIRNAIVNLLERELYQGGWTLEELGDKIEAILNFTPIRRQQRDKDAPKKTRTAYTFFCQKNRAETMEKMKKDSGEESVKSVDVVRALVGRWRELKSRCESKDIDSLSEMEVYKFQSKEDGVRYSTENAAFERSMHPE